MDINTRAKRLEQRRRLRLARRAVVALAVAVAAVRLWASGGYLPPGVERPPLPRPSQSSSTAVAERPWQAELSRLDACRARLLAARDRSALEDCYAAASPAAETDSAALTALLEGEVEISTLPLAVVTAQEVNRRWSAEGEFIKLLVADRLADNSATVDGKPRAVRGRGLREWHITLWRHNQTDSWRWYEVSAAQLQTPASKSDASS